MKFTLVAGVLAFAAAMVGALLPVAEKAEAASFAFYVAIPTYGENTSSVRLNDDWHSSIALDWEDGCASQQVGCSVYARGWGYQFSSTPQVRASTQAFYLAVGDCNAVWWHVKDTGSTLVVGHVKELHTNQAQSGTKQWYFTNQNYYNSGKLVGRTAQDPDSPTCGWSGSHVHETNDGGSNGASWSTNFSRFSGQGGNFFHNKMLSDWTRRLTWG